MCATVVVLGPQRQQPIVSQFAEALLPEGPVAVVSAGWQEREHEHDELAEHLGREVVNLAAYHRVEDLLREDTELFALHRAKQERLRAAQRFYRRRLVHAMGALRDVERMDAPAGVREDVVEQAQAGLKRLDSEHLQRVQTVQSEFIEVAAVPSRPAVSRVRAHITEELEPCSAILLAGGHIGALWTRLQLLGAADWIGSKPVIAWSGGAMMLSDRIWLFHDDPILGRPAAEVFAPGLGLLSPWVLLPDADARLELDNSARVQRLASRLAPARGLTLAPGEWLEVRGPDAVSGKLRELGQDGEVRSWEPREQPC